MPGRILICDDNPTLRSTLRHVLEGVNHWEVIETADGQEAVTKSLEVRPDVIVVDLVMPVKDGLTAAREISQLLQDTPIVLYTMHTSSYLELEAQKSGVRKVLSKSDSGLLISTIQELLTPAAQTTQAPVPALEIAPTLPLPSPVLTPDPASVPSAATASVSSEEAVLPPRPALPKDAA